MRSMIVRAFKDDGVAIMAFSHDASGLDPAIPLLFCVFAHMWFVVFFVATNSKKWQRKLPKLLLQGKEFRRCYEVGFSSIYGVTFWASASEIPPFLSSWSIKLQKSYRHSAVFALCPLVMLFRFFSFSQWSGKASQKASLISPWQV